MGVNPVSFSEIKALSEHLGFGEWEIQLIERLDDVVTAAFAEIASKKPGDPALIPFDDAEGVKAFMTRLTIQQNARVAAAKKRG